MSQKALGTACAVLSRAALSSPLLKAGLLPPPTWARSRPGASFSWGRQGLGPWGMRMPGEEVVNRTSPPLAEVPLLA